MIVQVSRVRIGKKKSYVSMVNNKTSRTKDNKTQK